jgi:Protein of unknown function (DUF667)
MRLDEGWNQIQFNLGDFTSRAYNTVYIETLRVQIHASCRIRRIFFSSRLYEEEELPPQFKIGMPKTGQQKPAHQPKQVGGRHNAGAHKGGQHTKDHGPSMADHLHGNEDEFQQDNFDEAPAHEEAPMEGDDGAENYGEDLGGEDMLEDN